MTSTPACAGLTLPNTSTMQLLPLYPRVRGADDRIRVVAASRVASTPAYAGLTQPQPRCRHPEGLYPRVRGADTLSMMWMWSPPPLPPRTRG